MSSLMVLPEGFKTFFITPSLHGRTRQFAHLLTHLCGFSSILNSVFLITQPCQQNSLGVEFIQKLDKAIKK